MQNPLCLPLVHIKPNVLIWLNLDDKLVCVYKAVRSAMQCTFYVNPE